MDKPIDMSPWTGRVDTEPLTPRWHQQVQPWAAGTGQSTGAVLLGFASDAGVRRNHGRPGACDGPVAIRKALASLAWHESMPVYDGGDVLCGDDSQGGALEAAQAQFGARVQAALAEGQLAIGLGGGHAIAFASWQGVAAHLAEQARRPSIGIVNFDAHFDLRAPDSRGTSGTPFAQIAGDCQQRGWAFRYACLGVSRANNTAALYQRAHELGVLVHEDRDFQRRPDEVARDLEAFIASCEHVYLTIDLDCLPAAQAPGVSAPAARGVPLEQVEPLIDRVLGTGKLLAADLAEFNPLYDVDGRTARVAARLVHQIAGQS